MRIFKLTTPQKEMKATITHIGLDDGEYARNLKLWKEDYTEVGFRDIESLQVIRADPGTPKSFLIFFGNPA